MAKVLILMATYNGARFLREQLDSILRQTEPDWCLLVRDDGSSDETVDILRSYSERDSRIRFLVNTGEEHGAYLNFHELIRLAQNDPEAYPYYAFSDQDDVWEDRKLETLLDVIRRYPAEQPTLLYSDLSVIDENGTMLVERQSAKWDMRFHSKYIYFFQRDRVWGCTALINRKLFMLVPPAEKKIAHILAHDGYMTNFALNFGQCIFVDQPLIRYRRHQSNVSAMRSTENQFKKMLHPFSYARRQGRVYTQSLYTLSEMLKLRPDEQSLADLRADIERGGPGLCFFCLRKHIFGRTFLKTLGFYWTLLTGSYKKYLLIDPKERVS